MPFNFSNNSNIIPIQGIAAAVTSSSSNTTNKARKNKKRIHKVSDTGISKRGAGTRQISRTSARIQLTPANKRFLQSLGYTVKC